MALAPADLADSLDEMIWSLSNDELVAAVPAFTALLRASGAPLAAVLHELSDEALARCVQADFFRREAFEEWLVNRYEKALYAWFRSRTHSDERAFDLVQDFYVKLLDGPAVGRYDPQWPFRPWLWAVVNRFYIDDYRRPRRATGPLEQEPTSAEPSPAEQAGAGELGERIQQALAELPPRQRRVLELSAEGRNAAWIARETGLPRSRVYRELYRARRALERALGPDIVCPC